MLEVSRDTARSGKPKCGLAFQTPKNNHEMTTLGRRNTSNGERRFVQIDKHAARQKIRNTPAGELQDAEAA